MFISSDISLLITHAACVLSMNIHIIEVSGIISGKGRS